MKNSSKNDRGTQGLVGAELADGELESVAGGINPQPLPPGARSLPIFNPGALVELNPQPLPPGGDPRRSGFSFVGSRLMVR